MGKEKKRKKKTSFHKKKWNIKKCVAQVSPVDFAFSHNERIHSQWLLKEEPEISHFEGKMASTRQVVEGYKISNKILMLTMKCAMKPKGIPVCGVPYPSPGLKHDTELCLEENNEKGSASMKVPHKLFDFLTMELKTRFDPSLHYLVGVLKMDILLGVVRKPPVPARGGCLAEEDVAARLVEEFGLLFSPRPAEDVMREVVQKCVVAFQSLEAEALVLEQVEF